MRNTFGGNRRRIVKKGTVVNSTDIVPFAFEGVQVRALTIDGEPWFVAKDVATALGYADTTNAVKQHCRGVANHHPIVDSLGRTQIVRVIAEADMLRLIVNSKLPAAVKFERLVFEDVLPTIRRTGSYSTAPAVREVPQSFAEALREYAAEVESHEATKAALGVAQPRAEAWDAIASAEGDYSVGDAAKILARAGIPTGPTRLFNQLRDLKWTYRGSDMAWRAYAERVEKGYLAEKPSFHYHPSTGERVIDAPQVRVTVKGLERLRQRLHVGALQAVSA